MVRDSIKPDVTLFLHYETIRQDGQDIVAVEVQRGTNRPYYIAQKGLRPSGVYVRQGFSSVPATDTAIRSMIKETDGDHFEEMRSLNQELTFSIAEQAFQHKQIEFGLQQMKTLKILNPSGIYTNLGLLLSDQCVHTIKAAVFQGTDQFEFKDRREFTGSVLKQLKNVADYLEFCNQTHSTIRGLQRIDTRDYEAIAVREALLNLLVHRDYTYAASALINLYEDRMELISIGGLLPGMELEDFMTGISLCRNQNLANVFYRLHLIEAYGTGIPKILKTYEGLEQQPVFKVTNNTFKIILPNRNYRKSMPVSTPLTDRESWILEFVHRNGSILRSDVERQFSLSSSSAARILRGMVDKGLLHLTGHGKSSSYILSD